MTVTDAIEQYAHHVMTEAGLIKAGWTFSWNKHRTAFGICNYQTKTIELSIPLTQARLLEKAGVDEVKDTILHEVAHALTPRAGHGPKWQKVASLLGAKPVTKARLSREALSSLASSSKYTMTCKVCGLSSPRHRKLTVSLSRFMCPDCLIPDTITVTQNY